MFGSVPTARFDITNGLRVADVTMLLDVSGSPYIVISFSSAMAFRVERWSWLASTRQGSSRALAHVLQPE